MIQITLEQAFARAFALEKRGEHVKARAVYDDILAAVPGHPGALLCIARQQRREGELDAARASLGQALEGARTMALPPAEIWLELAALHLAAGAREEARVAYVRALESGPKLGTASLGLGNLAFDEGDYVAAEAHYREAIERTPGGVAWVNLALALEAQRRLDDAEAAASEALKLVPQLPAAWETAASVALNRGELLTAEERCRQGLERFGEHAALLHLLGEAHRRSGALATAREVLLRAAGSAPRNADIRVSLARVTRALGRVADARREIDHALELGASSVEAFDILGLICQAQGNLPGALDAYARAFERWPSRTGLVANYAKALRTACDFERAETIEGRLLALATDPAGDPRCPPMEAIIAGAGAAQQCAIARRWSASQLPRVVAPAPISRRGTRLRVGYLSSDFREHPTAHLIVGLFERHDRTRVEGFAYSTAADDGSAIGRRVRAAFEHWHDLLAIEDTANAERIRADSLDVLIDLNGHTSGGRFGVLALRPASVQIDYMGFPGTIGYDAIDAIVGDPIVVPPDADVHYAERVIRLPRCYLVTDGSRTMPGRPGRASLGLPENAVVLMSFNQTHKLTRAFFDVWLDALGQVPEAVLWLWAPAEIARRNLRAHAARRGIETERILFADRVPQEDHIARLRAADLALDVLPYGSHTTGVDALWAGVPMLTCCSETFAGRVGASLLHATGLDELVTRDLAEYRAALLALAKDRARLAGYRDYLDRERPRLPLFDTEGFTSDWERMLESVASGSNAARLQPTDSFARQHHSAP